MNAEVVQESASAGTNIVNLQAQEPADQVQTQELILQNLNFAKRIARKFFRRRECFGIEEEEFVAAAYLGLCDAAGRFDPGRGLCFQTFSYCRINGAMFDLLRQGAPIPRHYLLHLAKANELREKSGESASEEEPSGAERQNNLPRTVAELSSLLSVADQLNYRLSVNPEKPDDAQLVYLDTFCTEESAAAREQQKLLLSLMSDLPSRERRIVFLRYFMGLTFDDMREEFEGASKSWISRLHGRALDRLRRALELHREACDERLQKYAA